MAAVICENTRRGIGDCGALGQQGIEVIETDLGPGFQGIAEIEEFVLGEKAQIRDGGFPAFDLIGVTFKDVHDSDVNPADFRGVVIEKSDRAFFIGSVDFQFLADLTAEGVPVRGEVESVVVGIGIVHVAADADGTFCGEPFFPTFRSSDVG